MLRLVMLPALATGLSTLNSIHIMRRGHIILCKWATVFLDAAEAASLDEAPYPAARVFGQIRRVFIVQAKTSQPFNLKSGL
jgi:hypothetical protein